MRTVIYFHGDFKCLYTKLVLESEG